MIKVIDVNKVWGSALTCYAMGDDTIPTSAEHFVDTCMAKLMREAPSVVFDVTNMKFTPSIQSTYIIAYRLVKNHNFKKEDLLRVCLLDRNDPFTTSIFAKAVMEAFEDYKTSN